MLEVGKLYSCKVYYLMLYPDHEAAAATARASSTTAAVAASCAAYWSRKLSKPVSHCDLGTPLLVLNTSDEYIDVPVEVLAGDRKGWIIFKEWLKIEEIPCP